MKPVWALLLSALALASLTHFPLVPTLAQQVLNVPGNYPTIQSALNAAGPGDTIIVEPGIYPETLSINQPVVIEGRNRQTTILNATGGGPAIRIEATGVRVSNITITNLVSSGDGILIVNSSNVTVSRVDILLSHGLQYSNGTEILNSQRVQVTETKISGSDLFGIAADRGGEHLFAGNELTDNLIGVGVFRGSQTIVVSNRLIGPGETGVQVGELTAGSQDIIVAYNTIDGFNSSGILLLDANNNILQENLITRIEDPGPAAFAAAIRLQNSTGNAIFLNDLANNPDLYAQGVFSQDRTDNIWNSFNGLGNYWENYQGRDDGTSDPRTGQARTAGDGVGDTGLPHIFFDYYPLMQPWNSTPRAPVASLRVFVFDQAGNSVSQASVTSSSQPAGQAQVRATSSGGRLNLFGIVGGDYTLSVSAPGYEPASRAVTLSPRTLRNETFALTPLALLPYVVVGAILVVGILGVFLWRRRRSRLARRSAAMQEHRR